MRGKVIKIADFYGVSRITPAYAGKSPFHFQKGIYHKDHPRLCGEKHQLGENSHQNQGSPPPMRGKGSKRNIIFPVVRITPAYAGKSHPRHSLPYHIEDHPRLCGEKIIESCSVTLHVGSPPPMRGKDVVTISFSPICRITPAYAGKSIK